MSGTALVQVTLETLRARTPKSMDELHRIGENDQPFMGETPNESILERRSILVLVGDDDGESTSVSLVKNREAFQQFPEEGAEVVENEAARTLLALCNLEELIENFTLGSSLVPKLRVSMFSQAVDETFVPLKLADHVPTSGS